MQFLASTGQRIGKLGFEAHQRASRSMRQEDAPDRGARSRDVNGRLVSPGLAGEALDRGGGGRIDHRDGREIDHVGLGVLPDSIERRGDARGGAEEEGTGNPIDEDLRVGREGYVVRCSAAYMRVVCLVVLDEGSLAFDLDRLRHAMQEKKCAEAKANEDARREIAEHHDREGREQHQRIPRDARTRVAKAFFSAMFQQTTARTAPRAASGM